VRGIYAESLQGVTEPKAKEFFLLRLKKFKSPILRVGDGSARFFASFFLRKKMDTLERFKY
jgi:hypothetical protein